MVQAGDQHLKESRYKWASLTCRRPKKQKIAKHSSLKPHKGCSTFPLLGRRRFSSTNKNSHDNNKNRCRKKCKINQRSSGSNCLRSHRQWSKNLHHPGTRRNTHSTTHSARDLRRFSTTVLVYSQTSGEVSVEYRKPIRQATSCKQQWRQPCRARLVVDRCLSRSKTRSLHLPRLWAIMPSSTLVKTGQQPKMRSANFLKRRPKWWHWLLIWTRPSSQSQMLRKLWHPGRSKERSRG